MEHFTPVSALIGGVLIGVSATMLMWLNGRIAGISGVFSGVAFTEPGDRAWRILFVVGLIAAPVFYSVITRSTPAFDITGNWPLIVIAGLLVGFGVRLGSGCTSGHGVCGLARLSPRSMASVGLFMIAGMATASAARFLVGG
ncbi:MAG: YeeE/YedE family protein [Marinicaulis sp.]|nr:YeeE/YedE family protein [Marinicaulis sp.]